MWIIAFCAKKGNQGIKSVLMILLHMKYWCLTYIIGRQIITFATILSSNDHFQIGLKFTYFE